MAYKMFFDESKCVACGTCTVACMDQWDIDVDQDVPYRRVVTHEVVKDKETKIVYASISCMHCKEAVCINTCPKKCFSKDCNTGLVILDNTNCIGCHQCNEACSLRAIGFRKDGKASKCNGCLERLEFGLRPACEKACQNNAITFQYVEDIKDAGANQDEVEKISQILDI